MIFSLLANWPSEEIQVIDIREEGERYRFGVIPGAIHAPYAQFDQYCAPNGLLSGLGKGKRLVLYCAVGERSKLAMDIATEKGITNIAHIPGGFARWVSEGGPVDKL